MRRIITTALALAVAFAVLPGAGSPVSAAPTCAGPSSGGDWPLIGNTADNARHQTAETTIDASNVGDLQLAWSFNPRTYGMSGTFSNTPIVVDGCVYVASSTGWVAALNADTGELVWKSQRALPGDGVAWHANVITGSPLVTTDEVIVGVNRTGSPYVAGLDRATGAELWTVVVSDVPRSATLVATPVYHDGLVFQGFTGFEFEDNARGGYAIIDLRDRDGEGRPRVESRFTIPDDDYDAGYRGAGIWCTAAIDEETSHVYACTSNPASEIEHRYTNSLLKIDFDRGSDTFGEIVGAYKGTPDNYVEGLNRQPACREAGWIGQPYYSIPCFQLDSDFGASPHLFRDERGYLVVGALQKSGHYHAVYADKMQGKWKTVIGPPCIWCNAASGAHDGEKLYTVSGLAAKLFALDREGDYRWVSPVGNLFHYQPVTLANGVAYTLTGLGVLMGYDTDTGAAVLAHPVATEHDTTIAEINSGGVAVARHTLYTAVNEFVSAYRLP